MFDAPHKIAVNFSLGAIAQLVARLHGMQEVTSSTLVSSTILCEAQSHKDSDPIINFDQRGVELSPRCSLHTLALIP